MKGVRIGLGILQASRDKYSSESKRRNLALSKKLVGISILRYLQSPFQHQQGISVLSLELSNGTDLNSS